MTSKESVIACLFLVVVCGCTGRQQEPPPLANAQEQKAGGIGVQVDKEAPVQEGTIGTLSWEVTDANTGESVAKGESHPAVADVKIDSGDRYTKMIALGSHFSLAVAGVPAAFALKGSRDDMDTTSWDWFQPGEDGKMKEAQGDGRIEIESVDIDGSDEVGRMKFLTDISIDVEQVNVVRKKEADGTMPPKNKWRIVIHKGSVIVWPSLVQGRVTEN
ncbi:MAG TPA: hypothetical protein VNI20_08020 [Fimbriimonadaceae bacterium]|nr:hypothetical protein [Fimbriimonadaceae bacterium]